MSAQLSKERLAPIVSKAIGAQSTFPSMTAHNDKYSPLLRLPGELRNQIYEFVFASDSYKMFDKLDEESGKQLGVHIQDPHVGINLTRACRKLYHETALLPFVLSEFRCMDINALGQLHVLLQSAQREVIRNLIVEFQLDCHTSIDDFLLYVHGHRIVLSYFYPNLERVKAVAHSVDYSSTWQQNWPSMNMARVRTMQDNKTELEDWLRDGAKQGFEVEFEEVTTKHGAWE